MHTIDRAATRTVRRLNFDRELRARFREDPAGTLQPLGLDATQVEAVISGDAAALRGAGIDVRRIDKPSLGVRLRARVAVVLSAVVGLLGGPAVGTAFADARAVDARRFGARYVRFSARRLSGRISPRAGRLFARRTTSLVGELLIGFPDVCKDKACNIIEPLP